MNQRDSWEGDGGGLGRFLCSISGARLTGVDEEVEDEAEGDDEVLNEGEGYEGEEEEEDVEAKGRT